MSKKPAPDGSLESVFGAAFGVAFMIFWTGGVYTRGGPVFMVAIGRFCLLVMVKAFIDSIKAYIKRRKDLQFYGEERFTENVDYSARDPWESGYKGSQESQEITFSGQLGDVYQYTDKDGNIYCPYCGVKVAHDFEYCPHCGKKLPFGISY